MATAQARPGALWADGRIVLRADAGPPVLVPRPFALVGSAPGADLRLPGRDIHPRHIYLQLDHRGLFALDLGARGDLHRDGRGWPAGWLRAGAALYLGGHRIEVVEIEIGGQPLDREDPGPIPWPTEAATTPLLRVALELVPAADRPWALDSELVILGRSPACGVVVPAATAAWVHAAVFRTETSAYLVNLVGSGLVHNGRPLPAAATLADGDRIGLGSTRFEVRLGTPPAPALPAVVEMEPNATPGVTAWPAEIVPPPPADLVPAHAQAALMAWMMGVVQTLQIEMLRRQDAFQRELLHAVRDLNRDHHEALAAHQARVEAIHQDLASLRADIQSTLDRPPPPTREPLPLTSSPIPPADPEAATHWLLERVRRLDDANRASWRDLVDRLKPGPA